MSNDPWRAIASDGNTPKYMAIVETLEAAIGSGTLKPHERLPTNRELSRLFNVTIATVTKAMTVAARRGLITARVGSGTYVRESTGLPSENEVMDLSLNILPHTLVETHLRQVLQEQISVSSSESLFAFRGYVPTENHAHLAMRWMKSFDIECSNNTILLTSGAHQGLVAAFQLLLAPGDTALCETLTYAGMRRIAQHRGVHLKGVQCDRQGMLVEDLEEKLRTSHAKVLITTPVLHNPTTSTLPLARRQAIAELCRKHEIFVIEDGINMPMVGNHLPSISSLLKDQSIFLTGYSKCIASAFRLGYAVVPEKLRHDYLEALVGNHWIGPCLYPQLAETMLRNGAIEEIISTHRNEARERYELARTMIKGIRKIENPGYHAWVECSHGDNSDAIAMQALRYGIRISPAKHFTVADDGSKPQNAYRISLGACQDRHRLENALETLATISVRKTSYATTLV